MGMRCEMRGKKYGFRNAYERLQFIRHAIKREEASLCGQEYDVTKTKLNIKRLEHDRLKVQQGIVLRP